MLQFILALFLLLLGANAGAQTINIFAASSTKLAMQEIAAAFTKEHPNAKLNITYSSTGKAYAQFTHGLKYDIFIAADTTYPQKIADEKNALHEPRIYAYGSLVLFSHDAKLLKNGLDALKNPNLKHISIANPRLAPYGEAALEVLESLGLKEVLKNKLVLGDNIAQSVQFVDSGAAELGLVAFSLIKTTKKSSHYIHIDKSRYTPMKQAFVLTKYAVQKPLAAAFGEFLLSPFAQSSFEKYGFAKAL